VNGRSQRDKLLSFVFTCSPRSINLAGPGAMDIHLGDPESVVTVVECCHRGHIAMALQFCHRAVLAKHIGYCGQGGLRYVCDFWSLSFLMFLFTFFFVPETKGIFLEDMDEIFGLVELSARMLQEAEIENGPTGTQHDLSHCFGTPRTKRRSSSCVNDSYVMLEQ
jgi:hypothetical protein